MPLVAPGAFKLTDALALYRAHYMANMLHDLLTAGRMDMSTLRLLRLQQDGYVNIRIAAPSPRTLFNFAVPRLQDPPTSVANFLLLSED